MTLICLAILPFDINSGQKSLWRTTSPCDLVDLNITQWYTVFKLSQRFKLSAQGTCWWEDKLQEMVAAPKPAAPFCWWIGTLFRDDNDVSWFQHDVRLEWRHNANGEPSRKILNAIVLPHHATLSIWFARQCCPKHTVVGCKFTFEIISDRDVTATGWTASGANN